MTIAYVLFKVRKELDHFQANTWKMIGGYFDMDKAKSYRDTLNMSMSPVEARAGWIYDYQEVDIIDLPKEVQDALSKLQPRTEQQGS